MLYQIHWQYRDSRPTEFVRQFDLADGMPGDEKHKKVSKIITEVNGSHPLPIDAIWMLCNEKSPHFWMTQP